MNPAEKRREWWRDAVALLLLAAALLPFDGATLAGRMPFDADNTLFGVPFFSLSRERPFALWNPYQFCGMPLVGNLQFAMFYPLRMLFLFFESTAIYGAFCFLHWLIASWGGYALGRVLGFRRSTAMFGALSFACGGFIQGRVSNPILFMSAVWFPGLLAAMVLALRGYSQRWAAAAGVLLAVMAFAGSPHNIFYALLMFGVLWMWRVAWRRRGDFAFEVCRPALAPATAGVAVAVLVFAGVFCPTWWHALELLPRTIRSIASFADVTAGALRWTEIPLLWTGGMGTPEFADKTSYQGVLGILLLLIALAGCVAPARQQAESREPLGTLLAGSGGFGMVLCVLGIAIALGADGGVYHLIYAIPGFRFLIGPARGLILFNVGWMLTTMVLFDRFQNRGSCRPLALIVAGLFAAGVLGGAMAMHGSGAIAAMLNPKFAPAPEYRVAALGFFGVAGVAVVTASSWRRIPAGAGAFLLLAFHLLNLWHFHQRQYLRFEDAGYFQSPPTVEYLRSLPADQPWRVLSHDALRLHVMDVNDTRGPSFLTPKLPDLYRIREAQGYDPMMLRDYVEFMTACAGRSSIDDPFRTAHVDNPLSVFPDVSGARYVIGNPFLRTLSRGGGENGVRIDDPRPVRALEFVSLADYAAAMPAGAVAGRFLVRTEDGATSSFPVRLGMETADVAATDPGVRAAHPSIATNQRWLQYDPRRGRAQWWASYCGRIELPEPARLAGIEWKPERPDVVFVVRCLAPEFEPAAGDNSRMSGIWRRGEYSLFENRSAVPLAYIVHETTVARTLKECAAVLKANRGRLREFAVVERETPVEAALAAGEERATFVRCSAGFAEIEALTGSPGLLVFVESHYPGWRVWVDGAEREIVRTNGIFQGVVLDAPGVHSVVFRYLPRSLFVTGTVAVATLLAVLLFVVGHWRKRGRENPGI